MDINVYRPRELVVVRHKSGDTYWVSILFKERDSEMNSEITIFVRDTEHQDKVCAALVDIKEREHAE